MIREYKKSYIVINLILALLLGFLAVNYFALKHTSYLFLFLTLLVPTLFLIIRYGYEGKKRRFTYELFFYIFAYSIVFLLITYFIGFFIGFNKSLYKLDSANLIKNIIPYFLLIILSEVLRYEIVRKGENSRLAQILVTIILILVDLTMFLTLYDLNTGDGQIKYVCSIVLPSLFKNIALLYFAKYAGPYPNMLYRLILDLKLVVLPIFPDFGLYFESIINTILPVLIMLLVYLHISSYRKDEEKIENKKGAKTALKFTGWAVIIFVVLGFNILTSSSFKYGMVSIGSGSMRPEIEKGDVVIYKKINSYDDIVKGQVIAFKKDGRTIVHRVIEIIDIGKNEKIYYTKGDANEKPDGYPISLDQVVGTVKYRYKYIGIPSVVISEMLK